MQRIAKYKMFCSIKICSQNVLTLVRKKNIIIQMTKINYLFQCIRANAVFVREKAT